VHRPRTRRRSALVSAAHLLHAPNRLNVTYSTPPLFLTPQGGYFRPGTGCRNPSVFRNLTPSRGNVLMVFNAMDEDMNGRVTRSKLLDVLVGLGCDEKQGDAIFGR